jgi:hypothetical protein
MDMHVRSCTCDLMVEYAADTQPQLMEAVGVECGVSGLIQTRLAIAKERLALIVVLHRQLPAFTLGGQLQLS